MSAVGTEKTCSKRRGWQSNRKRKKKNRVTNTHKTHYELVTNLEEEEGKKPNGPRNSKEQKKNGPFLTV